jgi:hypothetical protein
MLCLALGVLHPDFLVDQLSDQQIEGWHTYYRQKPFGHYITNMMLAQIGAAWYKDVSPEMLLPKVELVKEKTEEELLISAPGFGAAEEFLRSLQRGNRQEPNDPAEGQHEQT